MNGEIETAIQEQGRQRILVEDATRRAAATPLPGPLADAFLSDSIQITETMSVRRVVASDWKILQWLDSPIFRTMLELQKDESIRDEVPTLPEEAWEMCWQFTHTPKQCRELMAKGRETFRNTSAEDMADKESLTIINKAVAAIISQVIRSFDTKVDFKTDDSDDSKKKTMSLAG